MASRYKGEGVNDFVSTVKLGNKKRDGELGYMLKFS